MNIKQYMALAATGSALLLGACKPEPGESGGGGTVEAPVAGDLISSGSFEGMNDHVVSGGVEIVEADGKFVVNLGADFSLDNAPDPKVGLGKDGYQKDTKAGDLAKKTGASSYTLPAGVDPKDYNEVYIWCEKFGVPLGVAKLTQK